MYIDIAVVVIIVLSALIGLGKGFFKTIVGFLGGLISLAAAIYLAERVANSLLDVDFFNSFALGDFSIKSLIANHLPAELSGVSLSSTTEALTAALNATFLKPFADSVLTYVQNAAYVRPDMMLNEAIAIIVAHYIFISLTCLALFFAFRVVVWLISLGFDALAKNKTVNGANRFFGFLLGIVRGAVLVAAFFMVLPIFSGFSFVNPVYKQIDESTVSKPIFERTAEYTDKYFNNADDLLRDLMMKIGIIDGTERTMTAEEVNLYSKIEGTLLPALQNLNDLQEAQNNEEVGAILTQMENYANNALEKLITVGAPDGTNFTSLIQAVDNVSTNSSITAAFNSFNSTPNDTTKQNLITTLTTVQTQLAPLGNF